MGSMAGYYETMYNSIVFRSGQWQMKAMAGDVSFLDYEEKVGSNMWEWRNELDVFNDVDFKDLVYI